MALAAETEAFEGAAHSTAPDFDRPVDLVHLARYTLGNRSLEREVLQLFQTQSRLYLQRLREAAADKDWADAAHTIKGSARSIGAWRVARLAEAAEALKGKTRKAAAADLLGELERVVGDVNSYIESLLTEAGPDAG